MVGARVHERKVSRSRAAVKPRILERLLFPREEPRVWIGMRRTIRAHGASLDGTGALLVTVEARFEPAKEGGTEIHLSGLPDSVLRESRGRLSCVLGATGLGLGAGRLFLHLVPAARRKSGEALDLALVVAAGAAAGHLTQRQVDGTLFLGEVGIDGRLHAVPGGLACAAEARRAGIRRVIAPIGTAEEAAALQDMTAHGVEHVAEVLSHLTREPSAAGLPAISPPPLDPEAGASPERLDEVRGQAEAKLALQVAAAGGHGVLLIGPPGAGKSMLAQRLVDLLPPMALEERVEVTTLLSASGRWPRGLVSRRPFRAPHHTTSFAGLIGGGSPISAGEISLAHRGVLFLDELPEFGRDALEGLRQPLEAGEVHLARAGRRRTLPARFQLVAAMNPCPCGYAGHPRIPCRCAPATVQRYRQRISGPLLDRVDIRVELQPAPPGVIVGAAGPGTGPQGRQVAGDVRAARARAAGRLAGAPVLNAALGPDALDEVAPLRGEARTVLERAARRDHLSSRALQSTRRVARTAADLRGAADVGPEDVATALALRPPL